jgi:hypothetical protein
VVKCASEKGRKCRHEGDLSACCQANRCPNHILLSDETLEVPILVCGEKLLREGRVFSVAVERNDKWIASAEFGEGSPVGRTGRDFLAEFVVRRGEQSRHEC